MNWKKLWKRISAAMLCTILSMSVIAPETVSAAERLAPPGNDLFLKRIDFGMILGAVICRSFRHFQQLSHRVA